MSKTYGMIAVMNDHAKHDTFKTEIPPNLDANKPPKILFIKYPTKKDDSMTAFLLLSLSLLILSWLLFLLSLLSLISILLLLLLFLLLFLLRN